MNILMIMADQMSFAVSGPYGHPVVKTPNLDALAARGTVFENCYCPAPLCVPSRASMVTGRLSSRIASYDNGSELPASVPTFMHHFRAAGWRTILSGKMHFVGPDQLHGFEERLNPDIYPAGFDWTPDWEAGVLANQGSHARTLASSGPAKWTRQLTYDEDTHHLALKRIRGLAKEEDAPFLMCVSYSHPHQPFNITPEFWDIYEGVDIDKPLVPPKPMDEMHPYEQWIQTHHGLDTDAPDIETVLMSRRAYYAMVSYVDARVGELLRELERQGLLEDTLVLFTSDHGDMMGEHGMWFKRTFREWSSHVPLIVAEPEGKERRAKEVVSLVDLSPTLLDFAGIEYSGDELDGASFADALNGPLKGWRDSAIIEYCGEGPLKPMRALRKGKYKYVCVDGFDPLLFDLEADPCEKDNLAGRAEQADVEKSLRAELIEGWDPEAVRREVIRSQKERLFMLEAQQARGMHCWDYVPESHKRTEC